MAVFHLVLLQQNFFGHSSGREEGARIKILKELSYGNLSALNRLGVFRVLLQVGYGDPCCAYCSRRVNARAGYLIVRYIY